jgi:apolipoprotein D and lipocalin family protein
MSIETLVGSKFGSFLPLFSTGTVIFVFAVYWSQQASAEDLLPPKTVQRVELDRYMGTWYEIASFPQRFEKGCVASMATYSLRTDGRVNIINQCRNETFDGKLRTAKGTAWVVDKQTNAKLRVRFFWPFSADYWIIDLGLHYEYAVVGHPKRKYLWILSRQRQMDPGTYDVILERLKGQRYDVSRLKKTLQP